MSLGNMDSDFDRYRKQRIRFKNNEPAESPNSYENSALRELEQVEAREMRDQQLTREVHDFFADATRQAATIVERMAHDAEAEADVKIEQEMESFLIDTFARMNGLVMNMLQKKGNAAETRIEPKVANLVGQMLDEFRWEGTADLMDKHIGQDPFSIDLDDVRRELKSQVSEQAEMDTDDSAAVPIEDHLVANVEGAEPDADAPALADHDIAAMDQAGPGAQESADVSAVPEATAMDEAADDPAADAEVDDVVNPSDELARFKEALKTLVRQGTMTRDEARAAWGARLRKLGMTRA